DPMHETKASLSRGQIVASYLKGHQSAVDFLKDLQKHQAQYNGFNLLIGTVDQLYFYNPKESDVITINPGTYSVSNASLNTPWPKVEKARNQLKHYALNNEIIYPKTL